MRLKIYPRQQLKNPFIIKTLKNLCFTWRNGQSQDNSENGGKRVAKEEDGETMKRGMEERENIIGGEVKKEGKKSNARGAKGKHGS